MDIVRISMIAEFDSRRGQTKLRRGREEIGDGTIGARSDYLEVTIPDPHSGSREREDMKK